MRSLLFFVLIFLVVFGAHYKINVTELEELKATCGKQDQSPQGLTLIRTEVTKNNKKERWYTAAIVISKRHALVHARSLFREWKCYDENMPLVKDKKRYGVAKDLCVPSKNDCFFAQPNRIFFRKTKETSCVDDEQGIPRLNGLLLIEMHPDHEFGTTPICLLPTRDIFDPIHMPLFKYWPYFDENGAVVHVTQADRGIEGCRGGILCIRELGDHFGDFFVFKKADRNFFVGYHPTDNEGDIIKNVHSGVESLLMSTHAELIYNFTKIPSNYSADFFNGIGEATTEAVPTRSNNSSSTVSSLTSEQKPTGAPRAHTIDEFTLGDYDENDLMDVGDSFRMRSTGAGCRSTVLVAWILMGVLI